MAIIETMGTTTIYLRHNDIGRKLSGLTKEELNFIDELSPYKEDSASGWYAPLELHNGNIYPLIFWKGRLMRLEKAPSNLKRKCYNRFTGKYINKYEWTALKDFLIAEINSLDKDFKKSLRNRNKTNKLEDNRKNL